MSAEATANGFIFLPPAQIRHTCRPPWCVHDNCYSGAKPSIKPDGPYGAVWQCECGQTWCVSYLEARWIRESQRRQRNRERNQQE